MVILIASVVVALAVIAYLSLGRMGRSRTWSATVTPLASIIGSGFLVCGPLLAREFGGAAALAMAGLLVLAYAVGAVVRYNIANLEPLLTYLPKRDPISWVAEGAQAILSAAYATSVAYYLKLLAEFVLNPLEISPGVHALASRLFVTVLLLGFASLALSGGHRRMERFARATVSIKLGAIAGMLAALALYWMVRWNTPVLLPPANVSLASVPMALGMLITVQGFETSRYLGKSYDAALRIRSMRYAQWLSSAIYMAFLLLLTPLLGQAAQVQGVAGILDIMEIVAPLLGVLVLVSAVFSELSASSADCIGSAGLAAEVTHGRLSLKAGFVASITLSIGVVWLTDPLQVIAVASRAFAVFYAVQCALALMVARRIAPGRLAPQAAFVVLTAICLFAAASGAPAE